MYLASNLKFLRKYTHTTQTEFGKIFGLTRSNVDSYERGNAKPDEDIKLRIAQHFQITLEVLITKDLQMNPGLLYAGLATPNGLKGELEDALRAKDETIKELKQQVRFLQEQNAQLIKKLKVA